MNKTCPKCGKSCYAKMLNANGKKVLDEEKFCPKCASHLAPSGICLNACHLSQESLTRFNSLLSLCAKTVEAGRGKA